MIRVPESSTMRILLSSDHEYPAANHNGSGLHPKKFPSGSGYILHDLLAKGLAELGHDVFYLVRRSHGDCAARCQLVFEPAPDVDILHTISGRDAALIEESRKPWVATCHMDERTRGRERDTITQNWIYVSRTLAQLHGSERYVWNGIDPAEYIYSEAKDDYFLFMSTMDWGTQKGLDVSAFAARKKLVSSWSLRAPARVTSESKRFRRCVARLARSMSAT